MFHTDRYTCNVRNQRSIHSYIDNLFMQQSKLLPVRLDLGYKSNQTIAIHYAEWCHLSDLNYSPHAYLTREQIIDYWNTFLNRLKWNHSTLLKDLVGYIWKIEYGQDKGVHYHVMLLFNGNKVCKDYYYANEVGQLWLATTNGLGVYFNCSADKQQYGDRNCLKVTHRHDNRENLYYASRYFAKVDNNEHIARYFSNGRILGKGCQLPT